MKNKGTPIFVAVAVLFGAGLSLIADSPSSSVFLSELPPPHPNFIAAATGGRIYCGASQGTVWLDLPQWFTPDGGAEVHCDPAEPLNLGNRAQRAWEDRGYLINLYPQVRIVLPLRLTFEIDPAKTANICPNCFVARYYEPEGRWRNLPTTYDTMNGRVLVEISSYLPASGYPGYTDRFLIGLFVLQPTPRPATATPTPSPTPSPTLSPTSTLTLKPLPTPSPIRLTPTRSAPTPTYARISTFTPFPTPKISSENTSPIGWPWVLVVVALAGFLAGAIFAFTWRKYQRH